MKLLLEKSEKEKFFFNALCNGLHYFNQYGVEVDCDGVDYDNAKKELEENPKLAESWGSGGSVCYEDIFMQVLKMGKTLQVIDHEESIDNVSITLEDMYVNIEFTPFDHLNDMLQQQDDAITGDVILQSVFFKDIIFG
jgi:hypothetical protein